MSARGLLAELSERAGAAWWHAGERIIGVVITARYSGFRFLVELPSRIDPDDEPCRECDSPGGTHYDCDFPASGRMPRGERLSNYPDGGRS